MAGIDRLRTCPQCHGCHSPEVSASHIQCDTVLGGWRWQRCGSSWVRSPWGGRAVQDPLSGSRNAPLSPCPQGVPRAPGGDSSLRAPAAFQRGGQSRRTRLLPCPAVGSGLGGCPCIGIGIPPVPRPPMTARAPCPRCPPWLRGLGTSGDPSDAVGSRYRVTQAGSSQAPRGDGDLTWISATPPASPAVTSRATACPHVGSGPAAPASVGTGRL